MKVILLGEGTWGKVFAAEDAKGRYRALDFLKEKRFDATLKARLIQMLMRRIPKSGPIAAACNREGDGIHRLRINEARIYFFNADPSIIVCTNFAKKKRDKVWPLDKEFALALLNRFKKEGLTRATKREEKNVLGRLRAGNR